MSDQFPSSVPVPNPDNLALKDYLDDVERRILELYRVGRKISETDETLSYQRRRIDALEKKIEYLVHRVLLLEQPWWLRLKIWAEMKWLRNFNLTKI